MDDKEIIVCSAHFACEAIVLQPDAAFGFSVILDDVA
jgi:hypothetical protein